MHNILVVEDDLFNQELISEQIEDMDVGDVATAGNGRIALGEIRQQMPDLIVLDLNMPEMNGFQLIEELRGAGHTMPIVVITAMDLRREDYDFFKANSVTRVFEKGRYSADEFEHSLSNALQGASS